MKNINFLLSIVLIMACSLSLSAQDQNKTEQLTKKEFNVIKYGAIADGKTLNTKAIQKAIDAANKLKSVGTVFFPKGKFLSGSIELKSNVGLYFSAGAVLL